MRVKGCFWGAVEVEFFWSLFFSWGKFLIKCQIQLGTGNTLYDLFEEKLSACLFPCQTPICSTEISLGYGSPFGKVSFCAWLNNTKRRAQKKTTYALELQVPKYLRVFGEFSMPLNYNKCKILLSFQAKAQRANPFTSATLQPIFTISWGIFKPNPALPWSDISTLWWPSKQKGVLKASVPGFLKNYWLNCTASRKSLNFIKSQFPLS